MSEVVSLDSFESGSLHEIDERVNSSNTIRWGLIEDDTAVAVDVIPHDAEEIPFRLRVLEREVAVEVYEHPYAYLGKAVLDGSINYQAVEAA